MQSLVAIVTKEREYKTLFEQYEMVETALILETAHKELVVEPHLVLLDGKVVHHRDLKDIRTLFPKQRVFYTLPEHADAALIRNIETICQGHNITVLPNRMTSEQTVKQVMQHMGAGNGTEYPRVISFFGTHAGVGVSTVVLNTARMLGERVEDKVLVLSLNAWDVSDYFLTYEGRYLNELRIELKTKTLTPDKLRSYVKKYPHFYHLAGNKDVKIQRFFSTEEIRELIEVASATFDVVLIDAGSHMDNACFAQAFVSADLKILVSSQDVKGYRGYWPHVYEQLLQPVASPQDFILVLNKYQPSFSLNSDKKIQEEMNMSLLASIPDEGPLGWIAIHDKKLLFDLGSEEYQRSIQTIANTIAKKANLTEIPQTEEAADKKKGRFNLFGL